MAEVKNPKDLQGAVRVPLTKLPPAGVLYGALAMTDGAKKYGPFNWREPGKEILAMQYVDALLRHIYAWVEGEEEAQDSGVHHLGHAIANCAMLLDAQLGGFLQDDRPRANPKFSELITKMNAFLKERAAKAVK